MRVMTPVLGYTSLFIAAAVWILSVPTFDVVLAAFGYTPPWMFLLFIGATVLGTLAAFHRKVWSVAALINATSFILLLLFNNS